MMRCVPVLVVVAFAAAIGDAGAEGRKVGLAEVLAADDAGPVARAEAARAGAADAEARAAGAWPATTVAIATSRLSAALTTSVAIPLPIAGAPAAERRVARARADQVRAEGAAARLDRRTALTIAWLDLARAQAIAALADDAAVAAGRLEAAAQARLDAGDVAAADVDAARAERVRAEAEAASAADEIGVDGSALAGLLGWDPEQPVLADGALPEVAPPPPLASVRSGARVHPEARVAEAAIAAAGAEVDRSRRARWPAIAIELGASAFDPTTPGTDLTAGVTVELPVFGRGGESVDAARAGERLARAEAGAAQARIDAAIVGAHRRATAAAARARGFAEQVLPAEVQAAERAERAYREGAADLAAALVAQRALIAVQREVIDARHAAAVARAELARAAGAE